METYSICERTVDLRRVVATVPGEPSSDQRNYASCGYTDTVAREDFSVSEVRLQSIRDNGIEMYRAKWSRMTLFVRRLMYM